MNKIKDFFENNYFQGENAGGTVALIFDILLILLVLFLLIYLIRQKVKVWRLLTIIGVAAALYASALFLHLVLLEKFMKYIGSWLIGFYVILYHSEIRALLEGKKNRDRGDNVYKSKKEKEELINIIASTIDYLSKRKIGALITFERKDSLESITQNATAINAIISQEILTTMFTPGTACHDGGVVIRNNRIVCAGAYYPLSDNYDIPKFLGTRHRAAIGISERFDAITIVVSEETGNISMTISGNISLELTIERVKTLLDGYLGTK